MKFLLILLCIPFASWPVESAEALTFFEAYQKARQHDAMLRGAVAENAAQQKEIDLAFAPFLPQARISAYKGRANTDREFVANSASQNLSYDSENYSLTIRQSLINKANFDSYGKAKAMASKSDAKLESGQLSLMGRFTEAYMNLLLSAEYVQYGKAQKNSVQLQYEQAKKRYALGVGTITEVSEAEASLDLVKANELDWLNGFEYAKRVVENLIGEYPENYFTLDPAKLSLSSMEQKTVEEWIATAKAKNPEIQAAIKDVEAARFEVQKANSGHLPTLDLVASKTISESDANNTIGTRFNTDAIGLQLNVPIYQGGYVSAYAEQAASNQLRAEEKLSEIERAVALDARRYFNQIQNGMLRIKSLESSVKSYELALQGTEKGFSAGLRTNVDTLNAQEKLFSARRELAKERYTLILSYILFKQSAGILSVTDIQEIAAWLTVRPELH